MDKTRSCGNCGKYKTCKQRGIINPCDDWRPTLINKLQAFDSEISKLAGTNKSALPTTDQSYIQPPIAKAPKIDTIIFPPINNPMFDICIEGLRIIATNEIIPSDEPVFILLGRSENAGACLRTFQSKFEMTSEDHKNMDATIEDFREYKEVNDDDDN